jgi:hypothetical protein
MKKLTPPDADAIRALAWLQRKTAGMGADDATPPQTEAELATFAPASYRRLAHKALLADRMDTSERSLGAMTDAELHQAFIIR